MEANNTNIYLFELADEMENHIPNLEAIRNADPDGKVTILISSPGGSVDLAEAYIEAIQDSAAHVVTRAVGQIASAACIVWLHGDQRECSSRASFMFHDVSVTWDGNPSLMKTRSEFFISHMQTMYFEDYREVMSAAEIEHMSRGGEVYISGDNMHQRLAGKRLFDMMEDKADKDEESTVFTVTLESGFRLDLDIDDLQPEDFSVLNREELIEVGDTFGADLRNHSFRDGVDVLISRIYGGPSGRA